MAGVTDVAFRALCKKYGAGLTCTEFLSSAAIVRNNRHTMNMLVTDPCEKPVAIQLFGHSAEEIVAAANIVQKGFDILDVNCGCPAWKVIRTGAGSKLLEDPKKIGEFVKELVSHIKKPITVKIRIGIDDKRINAIEVAKIIEQAGAAAIFVHGRTQKQGYSGKANWDVIKQVKRAVSIPVIGNGDVFSPETFKQKLDESGVDYILIARGALGNPYIFKQINDYLKTGKYDKKNGIEQFFEYLELAKKYDIPFTTIKNHAMSFTKGIVGGAKIRIKLATTKNREEIENILT